MTGPALPIALATLGAVCFAGAAVLQHRAISARPDSTAARSSPGERLTMSGLAAVTRQRGWIAGLGLAGAGAALHATALVLAPLSVVQPVGVLAVPIAVVLSAIRTRRRPGRDVLAGVAVCVGGVAAFVGIAAGTATSTPPAMGAMLTGGIVVLGVVLGLGAVGLARSGWTRCVALAMAGATAFGLVSTLVRALSQAVLVGGTALVDPAVLATALGIGAAVLTGEWLVQQAYASGAPEVVVACMTVVDPIVAVLLGVVLLREHAATAATTWLLLGAAAAAAVAGVIGLARHHPDAAGRRAGSRPPDTSSTPFLAPTVSRRAHGNERTPG